MVMFTSCSRNEILFKVSDETPEDRINKWFDKYSMKKRLGGWYAIDWSEHQYVAYSDGGIGKYVTSVKLPRKLKEIQDDAFNSCYNLTSIKIPKSVTKIGAYAFCDCI